MTAMTSDAGDVPDTPLVDRALSPAALPVEVAPAEAAEPAAYPTAEAVVAAPVSALEAPPAAPAVAFELPIDELQAIARGAGLEWVESDADKIREVQAAIAAQPQPIHVPRERKPMAAVDEGPLVLVETVKDLSQIRLPFEQAPTAH